MKNLVNKQIIVFALIGFCMSPLFGQTGDPAHHATLDLNCSSCHSCETPTYENPCLNCCPDFTREGISVHHSPEMAPDTIYINVLSNLYGPSVFSHLAHAEMAEMSGGCVSCHHFNPPGAIAACSDCHSAEQKRSDLSKPGLKGAYHQQCLNCHREWSNEVECLSCHAYKGSDVSVEPKPVKTLNLEPIIAPVKIVKETELEDQPIVTFYHDQHISLYGYTCVDCHRNESCASCHNRSRDVTMDKEPHENCMSCHEADIDEDCGKCHDTVEKKPFNHAGTGFKLKAYHEVLACKSCHGEKKGFTRLNRSCTSCHKGWAVGNFNHAATGFQLDESHAEHECEVCHTERKFTAVPTCDMCHDEMTYPAEKPGRTVGLK